MKKSLVLFVVTVAGLFATSQVFASENAANFAPSAPSASTARSAAGAPVQVSCQPVKFTRPDVQPGKDHFMIVLRKGDLQEIQACNPGAGVHQIPAGVGVIITYDHDHAVINLPSSLKDDSASNGRCVVNGTGNVVDQVEYKGKWEGGLPDHVDLHQLDAAYYDKPAMLRMCHSLMEANKRNQ